jgi:hypothetical protein
MSIAFAALAEEYRRAGRPEEAVAVCRAGLTRHPSYTSARVALGRALLDLGELEAAEGELRHVLDQAPENLAAMRALMEVGRHRADAAAKRTEPPPPAPVANVIPFKTDLMPSEAKAPDSPVLSSFVERTAPGPALTSLDRFLDAIVTLKRA